MGKKNALDKQKKRMEIQDIDELKHRNITSTENN